MPEDSSVGEVRDGQRDPVVGEPSPADEGSNNGNEGPEPLLVGEQPEAEMKSAAECIVDSSNCRSSSSVDGASPPSAGVRETDQEPSGTEAVVVKERGEDVYNESSQQISNQTNKKLGELVDPANEKEEEEGAVLDAPTVRSNVEASSSDGCIDDEEPASTNSDRDAKNNGGTTTMDQMDGGATYGIDGKGEQPEVGVNNNNAVERCDDDVLSLGNELMDGHQEVSQQQQQQGEEASEPLKHAGKTGEKEEEEEEENDERGATDYPISTAEVSPAAADAKQIPECSGDDNDEYLHQQQEIQPVEPTEAVSDHAAVVPERTEVSEGGGGDGGTAVGTAAAVGQPAASGNTGSMTAAERERLRVAVAVDYVVRDLKRQLASEMCHISAVELLLLRWEHTSTALAVQQLQAVEEYLFVPGTTAAPTSGPSEHSRPQLISCGMEHQQQQHGHNHRHTGGGRFHHPVKKHPGNVSTAAEGRAAQQHHNNNNNNGGGGSVVGGSAALHSGELSVPPGHELVKGRGGVVVQVKSDAQKKRDGFTAQLDAVLAVSNKLLAASATADDHFRYHKGMAKEKIEQWRNGRLRGMNAVLSWLVEERRGRYRTFLSEQGLQQHEVKDFERIMLGAADNNDNVNDGASPAGRVDDAAIPREAEGRSEEGRSREGGAPLEQGIVVDQGGNNEGALPLSRMQRQLRPVEVLYCESQYASAFDKALHQRIVSLTAYFENLTLSTTRIATKLEQTERGAELERKRQADAARSEQERERALFGASGAIPGPSSPREADQEHQLIEVRKQQQLERAQRRQRKLPTVISPDDENTTGPVAIGRGGGAGGGGGGGGARKPSPVKQRIIHGAAGYDDRIYVAAHDASNPAGAAARSPSPGGQPGARDDVDMDCAVYGTAVKHHVGSSSPPHQQPSSSTASPVRGAQVQPQTEGRGGDVRQHNTSNDENAENVFFPHQGEGNIGGNDVVGSAAALIVRDERCGVVVVEGQQQRQQQRQQQQQQQQQIGHEPTGASSVDIVGTQEEQQGPQQHTHQIQPVLRTEASSTDGMSAVAAAVAEASVQRPQPAAVTEGHRGDQVQRQVQRHHQADLDGASSGTTPGNRNNLPSGHYQAAAGGGGGNIVSPVASLKAGATAQMGSTGATIHGTASGNVLPDDVDAVLVDKSGTIGHTNAAARFNSSMKLTEGSNIRRMPVDGAVDESAAVLGGTFGNNMPMGAGEHDSNRGGRDGGGRRQQQQQRPEQGLANGVDQSRSKGDARPHRQPEDVEEEMTRPRATDVLEGGTTTATTEATRRLKKNDAGSSSTAMPTNDDGGDDRLIDNDAFMEAYYSSPLQHQPTAVRSKPSMYATNFNLNGHRASSLGASSNRRAGKQPIHTTAASAGPKGAFAAHVQNQRVAGGHSHNQLTSLPEYQEQLLLDIQKRNAVSWLISMREKEEGDQKGPTRVKNSNNNSKQSSILKGFNTDQDAYSGDDDEQRADPTRHKVTMVRSASGIASLSSVLSGEGADADDEAMTPLKRSTSGGAGIGGDSSTATTTNMRLPPIMRSQYEQQHYADYQASYKSQHKSFMAGGKARRNPGGDYLQYSTSPVSNKISSAFREHSPGGGGGSSMMGRGRAEASSFDQSPAAAVGAVGTKKRSGAKGGYMAGNMHRAQERGVNVMTLVRACQRRNSLRNKPDDNAEGLFLNGVSPPSVAAVGSSLARRGSDLSMDGAGLGGGGGGRAAGMPRRNSGGHSMVSVGGSLMRRSSSGTDITSPLQQQQQRGVDGSMYRGTLAPIPKVVSKTTPPVGHQQDNSDGTPASPPQEAGNGASNGQQGCGRKMKDKKRQRGNNNDSTAVGGPSSGVFGWQDPSALHKAEVQRKKDEKEAAKAQRARYLADMAQAKGGPTHKKQYRAVDKFPATTEAREEQSHHDDAVEAWRAGERTSNPYGAEIFEYVDSSGVLSGDEAEV